MKTGVEAIVEDNKVLYKGYLDVPVALAFEAWSSQEHLSKWWGPDGFTITTRSMDFSNGGIWDFVMHGPDGHDYKNRVRYTDIQKPHHIYIRLLGDGEGAGDVDIESRIMFEQAGEGTNLTMEQIFSSREELERVNDKYGAIEGARQHIGNLAGYLKTLK